MANRLNDAGIARARGFALNVANFNTTPADITYGKAISLRLGGNRPFVIDISRNGNGPDPYGQWCNPPGRAIGANPTTVSGDPFVDALLWIKTPGSSDGVCRAGEPVAGTYWPTYADGLVRARYGVGDPHVLRAMVRCRIPARLRCRVAIHEVYEGWACLMSC